VHAAGEEAIEPRLLRAPPHPYAGSTPAIDELRALRAAHRSRRRR
jgi:hypothetical protein